MTRYWLALAFSASTALSIEAWGQASTAQSEAQGQKRIVLQGIDQFRADVETRLKRPHPRLGELRERLESCAQRACAVAWGKAFFPEANKLAAQAPGSAGLVRRMESDHQILLSYFPAESVKSLDRMATAFKSKGKTLDAETLSRAFDRAGDAAPVVHIAGAVRAAPLPVQHAPQAAVAKQPSPARRTAGGSTSPVNGRGKSKAAPVPQAKKLLEQASPAAWSEALVRAYFLPAKQTQPVEVTYRFGPDGEILKVAIPEHDYEEERQFDAGLVRSNLVRKGEDSVEVRYFYDTKGRLKRKEYTRWGASGIATAAANYDPATRKRVKGTEIALLPFSAPVAEFVLDWQISREPRLKIQEDTRPKVFHSPFWDGRWNGVSRGYTDPALPETWTKHPILKVKLPHEGIDMPMPEGTSVYPSRRGKVVAVGWESGYGLRVKVQHYEHNRPDGTPDAVTLYGHLSQTSVKKGQWVTPGKDVLGLVGSTGLSTGPHLHFEVHEDGRPVDPVEKLSPTLPAKTPRTVVAPVIARAR